MQVAGRLGTRFVGGVVRCMSEQVRPRVGVSVVILRKQPQNQEKTEVVLVQRGSPPGLGKWAFPGGKVELGETMAQCAAREAMEETNIRIKCDEDDTSQECEIGLCHPVPVYAVDAIENDQQGNLQFHYVVVQLAAVPVDPSVTPVAGDDAAEAKWVEVTKLENMQDLVPFASHIALEAAAHFRFY